MINNVNTNQQITKEQYEMLKNKANQTEENESFFDFKTEVNTWLNDEDKICEDGADDGKLNADEIFEHLGKGALSFVKTAIKHPVITGLTVAGGVALTVATGGAALPVMCAVGATVGAGTMAYGGYKAATAETDAEAKQAWETIGNGVFTTATSVAGAKTALNTAKNAGIAIDVADDASVIKATSECFKASPKALMAAGKNIVNNTQNVLNPGVISINGSKTLVDGDEIQAVSDGLKIMSQNLEDTSPWPKTVQVKTMPTSTATTAIKGSSLNDEASANLVNYLEQFDNVKFEDWGTFGSAADFHIGTAGNSAYISNMKNSTEAIGILSEDVSAPAKALSGLLGTEFESLIPEEK